MLRSRVFEADADSGEGFCLCLFSFFFLPSFFPSSKKKNQRKKIPLFFSPPLPSLLLADDETPQQGFKYRIPLCQVGIFPHDGQYETS